jgi:hypothetical protein
MKTQIVSALALLAASAANAALITNAPAGGTTRAFANGVMQNPCTTAASATVSGLQIAANGVWCHGMLPGATFRFGDNGIWNGMNAFPLVGDDSGFTTITIALGGFYHTVGAFFNYAVQNGNPAGSNAPMIYAIAADGLTVLESYNLATLAPISTAMAANAGAFRGISRPTADIAYFAFGGSYLAAANLVTDSSGAVPVSQTPEPAAVALTAAGVAILLRRRLA